MLYLLRQRNFGLLWFGGLISYIGNWITLVALPVYIYTLTGSYLATGATWMAFMLPSVVLGSVAGVYVDRWDRRVTMLVTNLLDVPLTLALLFVHSADQLWLVYLVTLLRSTASNFMSPAEGALLPKLVGDEHLPTANALNTLNDNLARLIGPAIGGAVLAYLGFSYAVLLDAVSFAVAAALIALIRAPRSITRAVVAEEAHDKPPNIWREWLEGLRLVRGSRLISLLFVLAGISMLSEGFFEVVIIPFVKDVLGGGSQELGWMMTSQAVGGLIGGVLVARLSKRVKVANLIGPGLFMLGLFDMAVFNVPILAFDLLMFALAGPPVIALQTGAQTLLQTNVEDRFMGRVFGAFGTTLSLAILMGQAIASVVGQAIGPAALMTIGGSIMAAMGLAAIPLLGRLTEQAPVPARSGLEVPEA